MVVDPIASVSTFKDLRDIASIGAFGTQIQSMDTKKAILLHPVVPMMLQIQIVFHIVQTVPPHRFPQSSRPRHGINAT